MTLTKFVSRLDLSGSRVDRDKAIIYGVRVASVGEARGHDQFLDRKTLEQVKDCASKYKSGLKVKFNPSSFNHGDAGIAGRMPNESLRIEGNNGDSALIGDLHCYKQYPSLEYLYEIAENAPEHFGLSMEFNGVNEEMEGKLFSRCSEIFSAVIVDLPAANPTGLFAAEPYGDVEYADPGYRPDKQKRYPVDTKDHADAAWKLINTEEIEKKYSQEDLTKIKNKIKTACNKFQTNEGLTMNDEEIKKLSAGIASGVVEGMKPLIQNAFSSNAPFAPPSDEEKEGAGVKDGDTDEVVKTKVTAFRDGLKQPMTRGDFFKMFREAGGSPVKVNLSEGDTKKNAVTAFTARIDALVAAGSDKRAATAIAVKKFPAEYKAYRLALKNKPATSTTTEE